MLKSMVMFAGMRRVVMTSNGFQSLIRRQLSSSSSDNRSSDQSITDEILSELKTQTTHESESKGKNELSFAKAFEKFNQMTKESTESETTSETSEPFPTLLRHSLFMQLGDPEGKVVIGRVEDVVEDDLYIDFGFKFNGVCRRPKTNHSEYVRGAKVKVRINDLELSDRFLGSSKDMTLLEADITLMGIVWSPARSGHQKTEPNTDVMNNVI